VASFWKPYVDRQLCAFRCGEDLGRLEHHAAGDHDDPLQAPAAAGGDGGVERGCGDALVLGQQVVRELVEVRDAADHRGCRDDLVAVDGQLGEQLGILRVTFDEVVPRIVVVAAPHGAVLAEVVHADHLVPGLEKLGDEISADESGRACQENSQSRIGPVAPQTSTTSRSLRSSFR
jgi:hypothetical protein